MANVINFKDLFRVYFILKIYHHHHHHTFNNQTLQEIYIKFLNKLFTINYRNSQINSQNNKLNFANTVMIPGGSGANKCFIGQFKIIINNISKNNKKSFLRLELGSHQIYRGSGISNFFIYHSKALGHEVMFEPYVQKLS